MFDVWENGARELSQATKRDSTPRKRSETERKEIVCPECTGIHGALAQAEAMLAEVAG